MAAVQARLLVGARRCDFGHDVRAPRVADRRSRFAVGVVSEAGRVARSRLDDRLDSVAQAPHGLGDEGDPALAGIGFLWHTEAHRGPTLSHRAAALTLGRA